MEKWKRLLREAQTAAKAARTIVQKAESEDRPMTEAEQATYDEKFAEATSKAAASDVAKKAAEDEVFLKGLADTDGDADDDDDPDADGGKSAAEQVLGGRYYTQPRAKDFGKRYVKSEQYQAFSKANPSGVGTGSVVDIAKVKMGSMAEWAAHRKATIDLTIAHVQPTRFPIVDQVDRNRLTLLDLISHGETGGNFEYLQVTGVTRNAKVVPEATDTAGDTALKPLSEIQTQMADAKVYTYADGYDVTNQLLSDAPAFATYMNSELGYSLDNVVEEKLLNGTGTNGEPKGILTTTGTQLKTYVAAADNSDGTFADATVMAFIRATRYAIMNVVRLPGGTVNAVCLSPEMDAAIDLLEDEQGRFYGQGPFGSGPGTLWGRPRVTSERLVEKMAILGDFKQVALLDREGLSVTAFNQHKDYAQRNKTYVRAELRAAQVIWKPSRLSVVKPAA